MLESKLLKRNVFFFVTEFVCGTSIMAVEIGASRLLAPYFSSSQIIWTIIIGSIMIAMAIGNLWGGKIADKHPGVDHLFLLILIAGAYICCVPFFGRYVIALFTAFLALFVDNGLLIWSSLLTCLILFVPPLLILGMVTPTLVKRCAVKKNTSGKTVGLLEALNTIGSIIGTFLPTFVTIPTIGTALTFLLFGGLLVIVGLLYYVFWFIDFFDGRKRKPEDKGSVPLKEREPGKRVHGSALSKAIVIPLMLVLAVTGGVLDAGSNFVFWNEDLVYQGESVYNYLQVKREGDGTLTFSTNVLFGVQSIKKPNDALTGMYYDVALAAPYYAGIDQTGSADILVLGNGTGTYASLCKNDLYLPYRTAIEGVEIDQKIIDISHEYFGITDEVESVHCDDGRYFITHASKTYDVIMADPYSGISIPFQMASVEFFQEVYDHLNDNGVMVLNFNMIDEGPQSVNAAIGDTVASVFPSCRSVKTGGNLEFFAFRNPESARNLTPAVIETLPVDEAMKYNLRSVVDNAKPYADGGIRLTDDNADVELRSMGAIDGIIKDELSFYRQIYDERGFWGLLKYLMS
ncbi:MAG: fused MFS/spermidine synthase [Bacilli bacterium]|jgi:spermidine synthase|nr:fused MFS/spermidine synthase [Bacilli bacterium]